MFCPICQRKSISTIKWDAQSKGNAKGHLNEPRKPCVNNPNILRAGCRMFCTMKVQLYAGITLFIVMSSSAIHRFLNDSP